MDNQQICGDSVMVAQQTLQFASSGSNPTSPHQFKIEEGSFSQFSDLLAKYHYKSSKIGGGISHHLVLKFQGRVYGGIVIGKMRHTSKYEDKAVELRRMVLHPDCPKNTASYFLSKTIWWLKNNTDVSIVYTFADQTVGHKGTCYKASNFEYIKDTPPTTHVLWKGKRYHPRSLNIDRPYSYKLREDVKNGKAIIEKGKPKSLFRYVIKRTCATKRGVSELKLSKAQSPNISLKTTPSAPSKLPTATSLNNNIKLNSGCCLVGR